MLTPGNLKLGRDLIWGYSLPSGGRECVGATKLCRTVCYAKRTEQYRWKAAAHYRRNLALSKTKGFVRRMRAFLIAHHVRVVRIHSGGEFYSRKYIGKWRRIIRRSPRVKFYTYTRAWRIPEFRDELERLAELPNLQLWYSADRESGLPETIPGQVRVAWLLTELDEEPSAKGQIDLIFRVQSLRRSALDEAADVPVCPAESGKSGPKTTCDFCGVCWKAPVPRTSDESPLFRRSLPLIS